MRNPFRKPKKCELRHSVFLKQTILGVKCAERSDKHFEPTTFEQRWDMNIVLLFYKRLAARNGKPVPYKILENIREFHHLQTGGYRIRPYGILSHPLTSNHKDPPKRKFLLGGSFTSEHLKQYIISSDAQDKKHSRTT